MELILIFIGLVLSFLFAGSETAFISASKIRLEIWVKNKQRGAILAKKYLRNPDIFLSTTLVGNNLANILTTSFATVYLITYWGETLSWFVITLSILVFGEIIPKVLFRTHAHNLILKIVYIIRFFHFILYPFIFIANKIGSQILKLFNIKKEKEVLFQRDDIEVLFKEAKISGVVDDSEHKYITKVLSLPDTLIREAMSPRVSICAIDERNTIENLTQLIIKTGYSKIPVYKNTIDNIVGVVFMYDLFKNPETINAIIKPVVYVPENKKWSELLKEFKQTNTSIAVVIDEYGQTDGIVTIEDLMEELFGEFDELASEKNISIKSINKNIWEVNAFEEIELINDEIDINIPDGDYETLAGFILNELGRIPKIGEQVFLPKFRLIVTRADKKSIQEVRIIKHGV